MMSVLKSISTAGLSGRLGSDSSDNGIVEAMMRLHVLDKKA